MSDDQCGAVGDPRDPSSPTCVLAPGHTGPHYRRAISLEVIGEESIDWRARALALDAEVKRLRALCDDTAVRMNAALDRAGERGLLLEADLATVTRERDEALDDVTLALTQRNETLADVRADTVAMAAMAASYQTRGSVSVHRAFAAFLRERDEALDDVTLALTQRNETLADVRADTAERERDEWRRGKDRSDEDFAAANEARFEAEARADTAESALAEVRKAAEAASAARAAYTKEASPESTSGAPLILLGAAMEAAKSRAPDAAASAPADLATAHDARIRAEERARCVAEVRAMGEPDVVYLATYAAHIADRLAGGGR